MAGTFTRRREARTDSRDKSRELSGDLTRNRETGYRGILGMAGNLVNIHLDASRGQIRGKFATQDSVAHKALE